MVTQPSVVQFHFPLYFCLCSVLISIHLGGGPEGRLLDDLMNYE